MKKKMISILLVLVMVLGLMTGCKGKDTNNNNSNGKKKLTVGVQQNVNISDYYDNAFTKYVEEALDIELEFVYFISDTNEALQQLTLMTTGDKKLPDVLCGFWGLGAYNANAFGEDGYFVDLSDLVEKYAVNYKAKYENLPEEDKQVLDANTINATDGGWYGMPMYAESGKAGMDNIEQMVFINQTWLDRLGLKMPTTVEELYTVCQAFATQDPNGNGMADEIPILGASGIDYDISSYLINAFVYYDITYPLNVTDGKVWDPVSTDEYRQALIYANKLCKEGLLSDMCYTMTSSSEFKTMLSPVDDIARVGIWCGHPDVYTSAETEILDEYVTLSVLEGETDLGGYTVVRPNPCYLSCFITKDCEDLETAMKFIDFFYLDETVTRSRRGEEGVDWLDVAGTNNYGTESHVKVVNDQAFFKGNTTWGRNLCGIQTGYNYSANASEEGETGKIAEVSRLAQQLYSNMVNGKKPEEVISRVVYSSEEYETRSEYEKIYKDYVVAQRALFITDALDPNSDSDWNAYLKELKNLGQETLVSTAQSAYNRMK